MADLTLAYGLGAARSGTTWLYRLLAKSPDCHFRPLKEMHYFNLRGDAEGCARRAEYLAGGAARRDSKSLLSRTFGAEAAFRRDEAAWIDTFGAGAANDRDYLDFVSEGAPAGAIVGDFTPEYGVLDEDRIAAMAEMPMRTRFIYIMRDPVSRLWSAIRKRARNGAQAGFGERCDLLVDRFLDRGAPHLERASDYRAAVTRISAATPAENRLFLFFEHLFRKETVARLCAFLGVRPPKASSSPVNQGRASGATPETSARLRAALEEQYRFVADTFGAKAPREWFDDRVEMG